MIEQFINLLQNHGLAVTGEEVADILWFATQLGTSTTHGDIADQAKQEEDQQGGKQGKGQNQPEAQETPDVRRRTHTSLQSQHQKIDIYSAQTDTDGEEGEAKPTRSVRLPAAPALPGGLAIGRALRPLMRRVPSRSIFMLDEAATAQHIADTDDWTPILHPEPRRWLDVALVVDETSSMSMWQHTVREFQRLLERQGAFRNIYLWGLSTGPAGYGVHLHAGMGGAPDSKRSRDPRELFDHHGQRLILLVSDCVALAWHNGTLPALLAEWGKFGMIALVQMLPEPLWSRTGLRHFPAILTQATRPGTPNRELTSERLFQRWDQVPPFGLAIPVFPLDPISIGQWARTLAGDPRVHVRGILLPYDLEAPKKKSETAAILAESPQPTMPTAELLHIFHTRASPAARRLAGFLAALSSLSLPVMRLVQRVMLPGSKQVDLAEVLLSGLIKRVTPVHRSDVSVDQVEYRFVDQSVRERLSSTVRISEVDQVRGIVERLSVYIEDHLGQLEDFQAFIEDWTGATGNRLIRGQQMVAQVRSDILCLADDTLPITDQKEAYDKVNVETISAPDKLQQSEISATFRNLQQELFAQIRTTYPLPTPFQAPTRMPYFVNRQDLIDQLTKLLTEASNHPIVGLVGPGGIGKTALAIHLAHELKDKFPDGILWADLDISTPEAELISFVIPFGHAEAVGKQIDLTNKAQLVRNILAEKFLLVVLNNAENREQVDWFIPSGIKNRILITTRNRGMLRELGATIVEVAPWTEEEAIVFLKNVVGSKRIDSELEAVHHIIQYVGGLPLALSIVAGYLKELQEITCAEYAVLLQEKEWRQEYLAIPGNDRRNVYKTFAVSYDNLTPSLQRLFTSLAVFDGPDFGSDTVAAINRLPNRRVIKDLGRLFSLSLINTGLGVRESLIYIPIANKGRYHLHPLLKSFAVDQLNDGEGLRHQLAVYYADLAQHNSQPPGYPMLDLEWQNIVVSLKWAYDHQEWTILIQGVLGLTRNYLGQIGFLDVRGYWSEARRILAWAYEGLANVDDSLQKSQILTNFGGFAVRQIDFEIAREYLRAALETTDKQPESLEIVLQKAQAYDLNALTFSSTSPRIAQQWLERSIQELSVYQTKNNTSELNHYIGYLHIRLASVFGRFGQFQQVITTTQEGLKLLTTAPPTTRVSGLLNLGTAYQQMGYIEESNRYYHEGVKLAEAEGNVRYLAALWLGISRNEARVGNLGSAVTYSERALNIYRLMGDIYHESGLYLNISSNYLRLGDELKAQECLGNSLRLARLYKLKDIEAMALSNLVDLSIRNTKIDEADAALAKAHNIAKEIWMSHLIPTLIRQQAEVTLLKHEFQHSLEIIEDALNLAHKNQDVEEESISLRVKGDVLYALHKPDQAIAVWQESLNLLEGVDAYELARTKLLIAEAILPGRIESAYSVQAKTWLQEALRMFLRLGINREVSRAQTLLQIYETAS